MTNYNIYPKQFRNSRIPIEKKRCFMLMPFDTKYDRIYGEIKTLLNNSNFTCNRADEIFGSVPIMSNVLKEILKAHFVIADLTGQNANVFYELGIAHSFKDAHNIILIAQSIEDIPFDIRHLSTIIYNIENIKYLTSSILKTINDNKHYYSFYEALQKKSIISLIHDDKAGFLETLQEYLGSNIQTVTDIINGNSSYYSEERINKTLDSFLSIMYSISASSSRKYIKGVVKVFGVILCQCEEFNYSKEIIYHLLYEIKLENYPISQNEIIFLQSDLAITLATNNVYFDDAMSWIIRYFTKSKSATVDLNRYSLEKFLMTSKNNDVDNIIVNSIFHENYYVREHMSDLVGEKNITSAVDPLITQLKREVNIYATSSMITALGKLGNKKAYKSIVQWFYENKKKILRTQHYFILKHIHQALLKLDSPTEFLKTFQKEFSEHLTPLAIF